MNCKKNKLKFNSGFTLIETLIAIMVLMTGVIMPMSIYGNGIVDTKDAGNKIMAYYLAQDAIEFVKYKINTELNTSGGDWFDFVGNCTGGKCIIDSANDVIMRCTGLCSSSLFLDSTRGLYNHASAGALSIFSRNVSFVSSAKEDGELVSSTVSWNEGGGNKSIEVKEYVFKWR